MNIQNSTFRSKFGMLYNLFSVYKQALLDKEIVGTFCHSESCNF